MLSSHTPSYSRQQTTPKQKKNSPKKANQFSRIWNVGFNSLMSIYGIQIGFWNNNSKKWAASFVFFTQWCLDVTSPLLQCFFLKLSCFSTCSKPKTEQNNKPRRADTFATNLSPLGMGEWINMAGNNTLLFEVYHFINEINKTPLMNIYVSLLELFRQRIQNTWQCGAFDETKFSI